MSVLIEPVSNNSAVFNYFKWYNNIKELNKKYNNANPFPHLILENFLNEDIAKKADEEFPAPDSESWLHYKHLNKNNQAIANMDALPPTIAKAVKELNSDKFVLFLSKLTGIDGLKADPTLEGGGLHQYGGGGFLNIHADFTVHPHNPKWRRKINVLLYLNNGWKEEWGGHIELWDKQMKKCVAKTAPTLNRCLIFNVDVDSYHGFPEPIKCPEGITRKSIALYYFIEQDKPFKMGTWYKSRPDDSLVKSMLIYTNNMAIQSYFFLKKTFYISDKLASNFFKFASKLRLKNKSRKFNKNLK